MASSGVTVLLSLFVFIAVVLGGALALLPIMRVLCNAVHRAAVIGLAALKGSIRELA